MQVSKWGNSLAVRLPAAVVEVLDLKEGDEIEIEIAGARKFEVSRDRSVERALKRIRRLGVRGRCGVRYPRRPEIPGCHIIRAFRDYRRRAQNLFVKPGQADWLLTRSMLAEEVQPGTSLLEWLRKQVSPDGTILAVEGQAVHYVLDRPVVAVIPPPATPAGGRMKRASVCYAAVSLQIPAALSQRPAGENSATRLRTDSSRPSLRATRRRG